MSELKSLRLSVGASPQRMANEMGLSMLEYRKLERTSRLDHRQLHEATFAALRIAVERDGNRPNTELFAAFDELLMQFGHASRTLH